MFVYVTGMNDRTHISSDLSVCLPVCPVCLFICMPARMSANFSFVLNAWPVQDAVFSIHILVPGAKYFQITLAWTSFRPCDLRASWAQGVSLRYWNVYTSFVHILNRWICFTNQLWVKERKQNNPTGYLRHTLRCIPHIARSSNAKPVYL